MRLAVAAACVVVAAFLGARLHDDDRCEDARRAVYVAVTGGGEAPAGAIERIRESCRGTAGLISVAGVLHSARRDAQAAPFAREATEEEPDSAAAWRALAATSRDRGEASAAERRANELDPLGAPRR
ncbi:MAG TPA: hypothetical protein VGW75_18185 [Solirubrobacteraceae bacterium]|jgi:hypothetical protein|nr:hypothetical protein [Solirubrobacteraceae bacterium]